MAPADRSPIEESVEEEPIADDPLPIDLPDEDLEEGWRAVVPSGRFFSIAIAIAGAGLIVAGLAMRFQTLLTAVMWR